MQNETQNQNIDIQEVKEEAPVQTEAPQSQEAVDHVLPLDTNSEPADIGPAVTMSSDDLGRTVTPSLSTRSFSSS